MLIRTAALLLIIETQRHCCHHNMPRCYRDIVISSHFDNERTFQCLPVVLVAVNETCSLESAYSDSELWTLIVIRNISSDQQLRYSLVFAVVQTAAFILIMLMFQTHCRLGRLNFGNCIIEPVCGQSIGHLFGHFCHVKLVHCCFSSSWLCVNFSTAAS